MPSATEETCFQEVVGKSGTLVACSKITNQKMLVMSCYCELDNLQAEGPKCQAVALTLPGCWAARDELQKSMLIFKHNLGTQRSQNYQVQKSKPFFIHGLSEQNAQSRKESEDQDQIWGTGSCSRSGGRVLLWSPQEQFLPRFPLHDLPATAFPVLVHKTCMSPEISSSVLSNSFFNHSKIYESQNQSLSFLSLCQIPTSL